MGLPKIAPNDCELNSDHDDETKNFGSNAAPMEQANKRKLKIVWFNVLEFSLLHLAGLYGAYLTFSSAKWQTNAFAFLLYIMSGMGITAGAHRLWTHRAYKAKWPLRLILIIFNTLAFQNSVLTWTRDHRMHHKYSDTEADPHNCNRGFFFCHIGWLMVRKDPEFRRKAKDLDLSDLYADPFVRLQWKYYVILLPLICFIIPTLIPVYFWNEYWYNALFVAGFFRFIAILNATFLVNSAAHIWGNKPYDKLINPAQNAFVSTFIFGEGYHNYHHTFPWDYKTSELSFDYLNLSTEFIYFFSKIGWAYDLKTAEEESIRTRVRRTGDGSHVLWGWDNKNQSKKTI